jgi:hypothetical protein
MGSGIAFLLAGNFRSCRLAGLVRNIPRHIDSDDVYVNNTVLKRPDMKMGPVAPDRDFWRRLVYHRKPALLK